MWVRRLGRHSVPSILKQLCTQALRFDQPTLFFLLLVFYSSRVHFPPLSPLETAHRARSVWVAQVTTPFVAVARLLTKGT